jgi:phosphinothricin acetyltransferase
VAPLPTSSDVLIRAAIPADGEAIAAIYNPFIRDSIITFEEEQVTGAEMSRRIDEVHAAELPWLAAQSGDRVIGYAYATRWRARSAYRLSVEITVYLAPEAAGRGLGTRLYEDLFARLRARGIHLVIAGISLPNPASVALHEKLGLEKVAHFREVGLKFGRWIDVGYWQALL